MSNACRIVILGAGRPARGIRPTALMDANHNLQVLDWILDSFSVIPATISFVGGYHIKDIIKNYPDLHYAINPDWQTTHCTGSLLVANLDCQHDLFVSYSDILFRRDLVAEISNIRNDIGIAIDGHWRERYSQRSLNDLDNAETVIIDSKQIAIRGRNKVKANMATAEFIGLVKFSKRAVQLILQLQQQHATDIAQWSLPELIQHLLKQGLRAEWVDVKGDWAELNAPQDLAHFILGTKAETLDRLRPMVKKSIIGEQIMVKQHSWLTNPKLWLDLIKKQFFDDLLIIRSSALHEDGFQHSNAGAFLSVAGVDAGKPNQITDAINKVIDSYQDVRRDHQILIQKMVQDIALSGVALTRSLNYGAPYFVINYDDTSKKTNTVTSGSDHQLKTFILHRKQETLSDTVHPFLKNLIASLLELETLVGHNSLDVEFIITKDGTVHIVQLRPIAVEHIQWRGSDDLVNAMLEKAINHYRSKRNKTPFLLGNKALYSVMSDWNPAEIIGTKPKSLAYSLYDFLIMNDVWAKQRKEYGYRQVNSKALMLSFAGQPYVDVRASFNSFVPRGVNDKLAEKLINYYLDYLQKNPHLHDKVEFEVLFTCMTFDFDKKARRLEQAGFNKDEIKRLANELCKLTNTAMTRNDDDLNQIKLLGERFKEIMISDMNDLEKAMLLLKDCKKYGTQPFSHLARSAFVAMSLLESAVAVGAITCDEKLEFLNSIHTVAKQYTLDMQAVQLKEMSLERFLDTYGHLRPGTYEVTIPCYRENIELYIEPLLAEQNDQNTDKSSVNFSWSEVAKNNLKSHIQEVGFSNDLKTFNRFIKTAIEGREYAKFMFTRNLSFALEHLTLFAKQYGLTRDDISYLNFDLFNSIHSGLVNGDIKKWLMQRIEENKLQYEIGLGIELPPLIANENDFHMFLYPESKPNYIGKLTVTGPIVYLEHFDGDPNMLNGKIVLIPQADPGYDWLFSHNILGLVTAYGGANSHMAIRAAEFALPAVIGIGEKLYHKLKQAKSLYLDCNLRTVEAT